MISCTYNDVGLRKQAGQSPDGAQRGRLVYRSLDAGKPAASFAADPKPLVLLDRDFGFTDNALVESHNEAGDELARNMLAERKTPLWFLVGDTALPSITDRLNGYLQALKTAGIHHREWVIEGPDNTPEGGYALMDSLIDSRCSAGVYRLIVTRSGRGNRSPADAYRHRAPTHQYRHLR